MLTLDNIWSLAYYDRYLRPMSIEHVVTEDPAVPENVVTGDSAVSEIDRMDWPLMLSAMMECECCWGGLSQIPHQYIPQHEVIAVPKVTTTVLDRINRHKKIKAARAERKSAKGYPLDNAWRHELKRQSRVDREVYDEMKVRRSFYRAALSITRADAEEWYNRSIDLRIEYAAV
jgi:hypothetical protein